MSTTLIEHKPISEQWVFKSVKCGKYQAECEEKTKHCANRVLQECLII